LLAQFVAACVQTLLNYVNPIETTTQVNYWSLLMDMSMTPIDLWNSMGMNVLVDLTSSTFVLALGYVALALPATRVILCERDDQLTEGIRAACRASPNGGRVVAVLGLLHVNGVASRLLTSDQDEKTSLQQ
jgi:predicted RNA methylase